MILPLTQLPIFRVWNMNPDPQCRVFAVKLVTLFCLGMQLSLVGCRAAPAKASAENCVITITEHCDEPTADVVVSAEVQIDGAGAGHLLRVVSVAPEHHPLVEEAIARAGEFIKQQAWPDEASHTFVHSFPFCSHPPVDLSAFGGCESREGLEADARRQGYRVRSVTMHP